MLRDNRPSWKLIGAVISFCDDCPCYERCRKGFLYMLQGMSEVQTNLTMSHNVPFDHLPSYKSTWELEIKPSTVFGMP